MLQQHNAPLYITGVRVATTQSTTVHHWGKCCNSTNHQCAPLQSGLQQHKAPLYVTGVGAATTQSATVRHCCRDCNKTKHHCTSLLSGLQQHKAPLYVTGVGAATTQSTTGSENRGPKVNTVQGLEDMDQKYFIVKLGGRSNSSVKTVWSAANHPVLPFCTPIKRMHVNIQSL